MAADPARPYVPQSPDDAVGAAPPLGVPLAGEHGHGVAAGEPLDADEPVVRLDGFDDDERHVHTSERTAVSPTDEDRSDWVINGVGQLAAPCVPEWCESESPAHDEVCDNAAMQPMTKRDFVRLCENVAKAAVEAYRFYKEEEGWHSDAAIEQAVAQEHEAATCFAGIGSCGRRWCRHG